MVNPDCQVLTRKQVEALGGYGAIHGINQTALKEILKSPKHFAHRLERPKKPTSSMGRGTANHVAVLEPERFMTQFAMWDRTKSDGTSAPRKGKHWEAFLEANAGREIVKETDYLMAMRVRDAVRGDKLAAKYLKGITPEVTLVWTDERTGVRCKARLDGMHRDGGYILDLKGVTQIAREPFFTHYDNMGYGFQSAFYASGYRVCFGSLPAYKVIAVELGEPHDVAVYDVPQSFLEEDYEGQVFPALQEYQTCLNADNWPGIANGCELTLERPRWKRSSEDGELSDLDLEA